MAHLAEGVSIVTTIVEEVVDTAVTEAVAATTTVTVAHAMMIVIVAPMAVVTIMDPAELIAMPPVAAMTATAAVEMIVAVVANTMVVTAGVQATVVMAIPRPQGILETRTEVEPLMIAQTIGTLVVDLRFANLSRCGALCEIKAPTPATTQDFDRGISESFRP